MSDQLDEMNGHAIGWEHHRWTQFPSIAPRALEELAAEFLGLADDFVKIHDHCTALQLASGQLYRCCGRAADLLQQVGKAGGRSCLAGKSYIWLDVEASKPTTLSPKVDGWCQLYLFLVGENRNLFKPECGRFEMPVVKMDPNGNGGAIIGRVLYELVFRNESSVSLKFEVSSTDELNDAGIMRGDADWLTICKCRSLDFADASRIIAGRLSNLAKPPERAPTPSFEIVPDPPNSVPMKPFAGRGMALRCKVVNGKLIDPRPRYNLRHQDIALIARVAPGIANDGPWIGEVEAFVLRSLGLAPSQSTELTMPQLLCLLNAHFAPVKEKSVALTELTLDDPPPRVWPDSAEATELSFQIDSGCNKITVQSRTNEAFDGQWSMSLKNKQGRLMAILCQSWPKRVRILNIINEVYVSEREKLKADRSSKALDKFLNAVCQLAVDTNKSLADTGFPPELIERIPRSEQLQATTSLNVKGVRRL